MVQVVLTPVENGYWLMVLMVQVVLTPVDYGYWLMVLMVQHEPSRWFRFQWKMFFFWLMVPQAGGFGSS